MLQFIKGLMRARLGLYAAGALLVAGGVYRVWKLESEEGVVAHMCAVFEAGGKPGWDAAFDDAVEQVVRPAVAADITTILRPGPDFHKYGAIVGACGTGKSTAVRQAIRALAAESKNTSKDVGVVYFTTPSAMCDFSAQLARVVGYYTPTYFFSGVTKERAVLPIAGDEPIATWVPVSNLLVKAAVKYKARHGVAPTLVLDAMDLVAKQDPAFFATVQDFAKATADGGLLRVVFVFGDGHALPLLLSSSASTRLVTYEIGDIADEDAIAYLQSRYGETRNAAQTRELVETITGGRFPLLQSYGASSTPLAAVRNELCCDTAADLYLAGVRPTHPLFSALASSAFLYPDAALTLMEKPAIDELLRCNILAVHADNTYTFYNRHVEAYIKAQLAPEAQRAAEHARWGQ